MAVLEIKLPLFWCTAVRHILLHIIPKMEQFGSFWAHSLMPEERYHVLLKKHARGKSRIPESVAQHHHLYAEMKKKFRLSSEYQWANKSNPSSIDARDIAVRTKGKVTYKELERPDWRNIATDLLDQIQDSYSIQYPWFKKLLTEFRDQRTAMPTLKLADFKPKQSKNRLNLTDKQQRFITMTDRVQVNLQCAFLYLFITLDFLLVFITVVYKMSVGTTGGTCRRCSLHYGELCTKIQTGRLSRRSCIPALRNGSK